MATATPFIFYLFYFLFILSVLGKHLSLRAFQNFFLPAPEKMILSIEIVEFHPVEFFQFERK